MGFTLVTGAASDIGKAICKTLASSGHQLLLTDLKEDDLKSVIENLPQPGIHKYIPLDLSDVEEAGSCLQKYLSENQVFVSNAVFAAGIFSVKPLRTIDYNDLCKNFDIALFSIFRITQILISKKLNAGALQGIVMISSVSAVMGTKGYTIYSTVKAGMLGLMKSLAAELSPKVRVNAILPGGVKTKATQFLYDANNGIENPRYLLGEGFPEDIANAVDFLLSEKARWMTGQGIVVDGGLTC
jgi:NAD(P)-dependent dehydrogenase (short-subunit alcohol dehydrogenase family)